MKKLLQIGAVFCGILISTNVYSQEESTPSNAPMVVDQGTGGACCQQECPPDAPCEQPVGDCWCKYVTYKPCYYTTKRCVEEQVPCTKKCCRMVPQYYEVQRCKYVPQYYTETCCRQVPEYYDVQEFKCCKKWVCDQHCKYVPQYYWKHICGDQACQTPCPK